MADSHTYQSSVWSSSEPYGTHLQSTPQPKTPGVICMSSTPLQTPMNWTLWKIAIAVRAVYGVNLQAHSYEAPHSKKLWGYPYVEYPIANTCEADPMADSHSCQSSVWSEPYRTQLQSTPQGLSVWQMAIAIRKIVWSWSETSGTHPIAKCYGVILTSSTPQQTPMKRTLWQIAIAGRAVYGVNLMAHSYTAPHSQKLRGYLSVTYPMDSKHLRIRPYRRQP